MTRVTQSSQRLSISESESSPSHRQNVTRVDSSPSHDSDSPIPESSDKKLGKMQVGSDRVFIEDVFFPGQSDVGIILSQ